MKLAICLSAILVLGILVISPTSGYDSLYGRTFSLFNLLQSPQNQFKNMAQRFATLDVALNFLTSQFSSLQSQITSLASQISALTTTVNSLTQARCPGSIAATGRVIGTLCYTLGTTPKTFPEAASDCSLKGGKLVEPSPNTQANGQALYNSIQAAFGSTFTNSVTLGPNQNLWLGIQKPVTATTFSVLSTGLPLVIADPALTLFGPPGTGTAGLGAAAAAGAPEGITLSPTGTYINEVQSVANKRNYICQFNAL